MPSDSSAVCALTRGRGLWRQCLSACLLAGLGLGPLARAAGNADVRSAVAAPNPEARSAVAAPAESRTVSSSAQDMPVMVPVTPTASQRELSPDVLENLRLLTGQNSLEARQIGAQRMLRQGPAAVGVLRQTLFNQPSNILIQAIAQAVPDIKDPPPELIDPLLKWLAAEEPEVRAAVVTALSTYRNNDLAGKLRAIAAASGNSQPQRLAAVTVLSRLADRDAIEALIDLLDIPEEPIRTACLNSLAQLTGASFGSDVAQWRRWWQASRNRKPQEWLAALNASLMSENRELNDRVKYLRGLLSKAYRDLYYATPEIDRPKRLVSYLSNQQVPEVRGVGIDLVNMLITDSKTVAPEVVDQLHQTVLDPEPQVRIQTIRVLGDLRNSQDASLLLDVWRHEADPVVGQAIARALGRLGNPAAIPVLIAHLSGNDTGLAAACAAGLGLLCQRGNTNAVSAADNDHVITALKGAYEVAADKALRQELLDAMAKIADERFRGQFVAALQNTDLVYRQIAVKAFADLNGPDDADRILSPLLNDGEPGVREAACAALGKIGKTRQISLLLQRCDEQSESNAAVRRAARDAAITVMLRQDSLVLKKELDRLADLPGQSTVLIDVLESALAQTSNRATDNRMQAALLAALAKAKAGAGQKEAAAALWLRVVTIQPNHPLAVTALARVLIEIDKPDQVAMSIQQIAGGQSGALVDLLTALTREIQADRRLPGQGPAGGEMTLAPSARALGDAVGRIDTTGWPMQGLDALRTLLRACGKADPQATSSGPASAPSTASDPVTVAGRSPRR